MTLFGVVATAAQETVLLPTQASHVIASLIALHHHFAVKTTSETVLSFQLVCFQAITLSFVFRLLAKIAVLLPTEMASHLLWDETHSAFAGLFCAKLFGFISEDLMVKFYFFEKGLFSG